MQQGVSASSSGDMHWLFVHICYELDILDKKASSSSSVLPNFLPHRAACVAPFP
jgi:hypothetical protein